MPSPSEAPARLVIYARTHGQSVGRQRYGIVTELALDPIAGTRRADPRQRSDDHPADPWRAFARFMAFVPMLAMPAFVPMLAMPAFVPMLAMLGFRVDVTCYMLFLGRCDIDQERAGPHQAAPWGRMG
jgi:hypothetical protein